MQTNIKNNDDLIRGIKIILSKYRCSFSEDEQVLLQECIDTMEKANAHQDPQLQLQATVNVVSTILRIFSIIDHFKDLF